MFLSTAIYILHSCHSDKTYLHSPQTFLTTLAHVAYYIFYVCIIYIYIYVHTYIYVYEDIRVYVYIYIYVNIAS